MGDPGHVVVMSPADLAAWKETQERDIRQPHKVQTGRDACRPPRIC